MSDWILSHVPNGRALILEQWNALDEKERLSAPLGPYREQAEDLQRNSASRFIPEGQKVPSLAECLARLDQEETAIVPAVDLAEKFEQERLAAEAVRQEFLALAGTGAEESASSTSTGGGNGTLSKTASTYDRERAKLLTSSALAHNLRRADGIDLVDMLARNPMEEDERIGFTPHRLTEHLSEVEKQMKELLENKMGWKAIKDAEIEEAQRRVGRKFPKSRRRGRAPDGLVQGLNLPKAKAKSWPAPHAQSSSSASCTEVKKKSKSKKKKKTSEDLTLLEPVEEDEESGEEVEDAQCNECGIYGVMNRCRRCDALLCSMTCREEHRLGTCSGKLLGGASSSGSSCEGSDEEKELPDHGATDFKEPSAPSDMSHTLDEVAVSDEKLLSSSDIPAQDRGEVLPKLPAHHDSDRRHHLEDAIPSLDDLLARLDQDEMDDGTAG